MFKYAKLILSKNQKILLNNNTANVEAHLIELRRQLSTKIAQNESVKQDKYQELNKMERKPLYLDAQATTPVDPRVLDAMLPYMTNMYGNPHSRTHAYGWETEKAVENAREVNKKTIALLSSLFWLFTTKKWKEVATLIGADPKEIIFTSGATESNNIAIKGVARFYKSSKKHIITSTIVKFLFRSICGF